MPLALGTLASDSLTEFARYASSNANALAAAAAAFVEDLVATRDADQIFTPDTLEYLTQDVGDALTTIESTRPAYISVLDTVLNGYIDQIAALEVPDVPAVEVASPAFPTLEAERPSISFPARPDTDVGLAPSDAPDIVEATVPDAPTLVLPTVPTFEELQLPVAPSVTLPTFAAQAPTFNLAAPTANFSYVDTGYTSELRDPLIAKLLYDLENGGYGIEADDEAALWGRARDRAEQQGRLAMEQIERQAASTSFPMPQGAYFAQQERARAELARAMSEANREIALKRADMYVENRKFTIQEVQRFEQISIELYNAIQERALNAAKALVELGVAIYDAGVRNFSAQLQAYQVEAQVFESRMRAELAKLELFKGQIEAESLRGQFNLRKVDLYRAQLDGLRSVSELYRTRLEASSMLMQVQGQRLELFKTRVSAYSERVRAKAAEYDMYRAAVAGESAKMEIYRTDIAGYQARVSAEEARVRTITQGNETLLQRYRSQVAQYQARLEGLTKQVDARQERNKLYVDATTANVGVYRALADAVVAGTNSRIASARLNNEWNIAALNSRVEQTRSLVEQWRTTQNFRAEIDKYGAKLYSDPMTATLAGLAGLSVKTA